jgi:prophage regulatory protein
MSTAALAITPPIRILRLPEVCKATGLGRAMIYRLQAEQRFPKSVKITEHAVGWIESEVQIWLALRAAARVND